MRHLYYLVMPSVALIPSLRKHVSTTNKHVESTHTGPIHMIGKVETGFASEFDTSFLQLCILVSATWRRGFDVHIVTFVECGEEKAIRVQFFEQKNCWKLVTARRASS